MPRIDQRMETAQATSSTGRRFGRRVGRIVGWGVAGSVVIVIVAVGATALLDASDRRRIPPPGELVELADGRRMHVHVASSASGVEPGSNDRPTVVLEAGSGGTAATMAWIQRQLADQATVVAYDRAGYGFSDPSEVPLDAASVVADLHEALGASGVDGPYVLVGHSLGGGYVRVFAATHPEEVAGLVLIDPVHEQQLERLPADAIANLEQAEQQLAVAPALARLGVFRLTDPQAAIVASLPADAGEQHRARSVTATGMRAYGREVAVLPDLLEQIGRARDVAAPEAFGGIPVRVVSAGEPAQGETPRAREVMDALHDELARRSPVASRVVIEGADHLGLVIDPEHAGEVAAVVVGLLDELAPVARPSD